MKLNMLAFAIPFFISFMVLEYLLARKRNLSYQNMEDTISNLSVGIAERLLDVFTTGAFFAFYNWLHLHFAIFKIEPGVILWVCLLICTDFIWYWYHRFAHEINLFWAVHVVHHQSEDFNYSVSGRITVFQSVVRTGFWAILPVIGFPPGMIMSILLLHGLYPFFTHTKLVGKLGILEYLFVTPSHHRVHHACNEQYLDKNYGDVLIIWDKLFGTFQKEEEEIEIRYGLTKPFQSRSFLWQHFHYLIELYLASRDKSGWKQKLGVFVAAPASVDQSLREKAERAFHIFEKTGEKMKQPLNRYVIWQILLCLVVLFSFILFGKYVPFAYQIIIGGLIFLTLINCGAIMEQKIWIVYLECSRLLLAGFGLLLWFKNLWTLALILTLLFLVFACQQYLKKQYLTLVYARLAR